MLPETIETEHLTLRAMKQEDAQAVWAMWGDRETAKYLCDPYYKTPEELRKLFSEIAEWRDYPFAVTEKDSPAVIGTGSIGPEGKNGEWGFGYCLRRDKWNRGYATETAKAMISFARRKGIHDFTAECAVENAASGRVLQKCGMHAAQESSFEKQGTGIIYPSLVYKLHLE